MAILGEHATYKIGNIRFPYDSVTYYQLLIKVSNQEEIIQKLQTQLENGNKNGNS